MSKVLSYKSLMKFLEQQWELNHREPSINIHRNDFIDRFGSIGFEFINQFLKDLDERYHAIRVIEYAYSEKWEDEVYMNLCAEEIFGSNLILKTKQAQPTATQTAFPPKNIWPALRAAKEKAAQMGDRFSESLFLVRVRRL